VTHRKQLRDELVSILRMVGRMPAPTRADLPAPVAKPAEPEPAPAD
jgi:acetyl-CoA carboxylase carboxyl transferase subunit beta